MKSLNVKVYDPNGKLYRNLNYPDGYKSSSGIMSAITKNEGVQIDIGIYKMKNMLIQLKSYQNIDPSVTEENYPFSKLIYEIKACPKSGYYTLRNIIPGLKRKLV